MATSDLLHWPRFLNSALPVYHIIYHHIIDMSPFKAIYGRKTNIAFSILPIFDSLVPGSAEAEMQLIANKLFRLQALALPLCCLSPPASCQPKMRRSLNSICTPWALLSSYTIIALKEEAKSSPLLGPILTK